MAITIIFFLLHLVVGNFLVLLGNERLLLDVPICGIERLLVAMILQLTQSQKGKEDAS